jgi:hypothetical protein
VPHIPKVLRPILKSDPKQACLPGELNFLFTVELCRRWKETPCYTTAHEMSTQQEEFVSQLWPKVNQELFTLADLDNAFFLAYLCFFHSVVMPYEEKKAAENGDVYKEEGVR